ncbi:hypothetical protein ASG25_10670 [Rhizobium sp. Leaf384]|uniref:hypothetical protein n=1 Tax=Rhizobium sp. Leaf384 TaxID=1736358 RepID=UPI000715AE42|nr:hypothetical protein [Rhizobium sp. Leaf384]KQS79041.1 hypothetical protein ASG25_10670 [Rhizobium sp. Leaf384]
MADRATTNPGAVQGSDSARANDLSTDMDDPANLDFNEPNEANEEDEADQGSQGETDEAAQDADQEADATAETDDEQEAEEPEAEPAKGKTADDESILVTLKGGEQVPIKELKLGYMRERDYRVKTSEIGNKTRSLEELSNRVTNTATTIAQFLISQMPQEPNPSLAMQDPGRYVQERAVYEAAALRVNQILAQANEPKQVVQQLTQDQKTSKLAQEDAKLREYFPETATPEGREKFFDGAFSTGNELGFSTEEMQNFDDHRYLRVIHYARLGLAAEQAKKKAMTKVNNAPAPVTPKPKAQGANVAQVRKNQDAMQRLGKTGSIKDALNIDFE